MIFFCLYWDISGIFNSVGYIIFFWFIIMVIMEVFGSFCSRGEILFFVVDVGRVSSGSFYLVVNIGVESVGYVGLGVIDGVVRVRRNINVESFVVLNILLFYVDGRVSLSELRNVLRVYRV